MIEIKEGSSSGDSLIITDDVVIINNSDSDYIFKSNEHDVIIKWNSKLLKIKNDDNIYRIRATLQYKDDIRMNEPNYFIKIDEIYIVEKEI